MAREHPNALPAGYRWEEYEIVRMLGSGGFGITYLAKDSQLHQQVALKEYFPHGHASRSGGARVVADAETRDVFDWGFRRFIDEARTLHGFRHPNVVASRRYFRANGTAYIVLEYVQGKPLAAILDSRGRLSLTEWRPWLDRLLHGLEHVHGHNYLHRDITPRNILIREADNQPVLVDFGAARIASGERTRTVVLTEAYAPIEQHSARATQGPFTDIYSLAAVSYRALTGETPPSAPDRAVDDEYVPLAQRTTDWPDWMHVVDRALAPAPKDRPQTMAGWRAELNAAAANEWMWGQTVQAELSSVRHGLTPLHRAAAGEPVPAVVALVLGDGDIHALTRSGRTPLHSAARRNPNPAVLASLLDHGADIHRRTRRGGTPLHFAAWGNPNPAVIALLLDRGADIHAESHNDTTALHAAAWGNANYEVAGLLLDRGADVQARDANGATPLHLAAWKNQNPAVVRLLLDRGAQIEARDTEGVTPLHEAAERNRNPAVAALLLDRGGDVSARDKDGATPLHYAAWGHQDQEVITLLLNRGADIQARNKLGRTALDEAARFSTNTMVQRLSRGVRAACGAAPRGPSVGRTKGSEMKRGDTLRSIRVARLAEDAKLEETRSEAEDYYRFEFGTNEAEEQMAEGYAAGDDEDDKYAAH